MLQRIRLGLEQYEQTVKRERYTSICQLGFQDDDGCDIDDFYNESINRLEKVGYFEASLILHI